MSRSARSECGSPSPRTTDRAEPRLKRSRLFKRGCRHEPFNESHLRYVWAAYRRGALGGPLFPEGLEPEAFRAAILDLAVNLIRAHGEVTVLVGQTRYGEVPVGLVITVLTVGPEQAACASSHVRWFPEASRRNKLECAARFLVDLKETVNVSLTAAEPNWPFFGHLCNYGILRPVGKFRKWFADGGDAMFYQAVR